MTEPLFAPGRKTVVGMAHLPPLPGAPGYDADGAVEALIDWARADVAALQSGGIDAIMFGNEADRPYELAAPPEGLAAFAAVIAAVKPDLTVPFGVNYLWDPVASVSLTVATGARFVREIMTGVYAADMGLWEPAGAAAVRLRDRCGRADLKLLFNINAEFATSLDTRPTPVRAASAVFSSLADVVCVSGPMTGQGVDMTELAAVKQAVGDVPVLANTGVTTETVPEILRHADGCVVGTHLKRDGVTWNPVDRDRVARFMAAVDGAR